MQCKSLMIGKVLLILFGILVCLKAFSTIDYVLSVQNGNNMPLLIIDNITFSMIQGLTSLAVVIVLLMWAYKIHEDLNRIFDTYPISPGMGLVSVLIPIYNLYGLWHIFMTMHRHFSGISTTNGHWYSSIKFWVLVLYATIPVSIINMGFMIFTPEAGNLGLMATTPYKIAIAIQLAIFVFFFILIYLSMSRVQEIGLNRQNNPAI